MWWYGSVLGGLLGGAYSGYHLGQQQPFDDWRRQQMQNDLWLMQSFRAAGISDVRLGQSKGMVKCLYCGNKWPHGTVQCSGCGARDME